NSSDYYSTEIEYTHPITDSLRFRIATELEWDSEVNDAKTFDFDVVSQSYTDLNELQTNYTTSNKYTISPKAGLTYEKDKFRFTLSSTTSIVDFDNHSLYLNNTTDLNQHYILPYAKAQIRYKLEKS